MFTSVARPTVGIKRLNSYFWFAKNANIISSFTRIGLPFGTCEWGTKHCEPEGCTGSPALDTFLIRLHLYWMFSLPWTSETVVKLKSFCSWAQRTRYYGIILFSCDTWQKSYWASSCVFVSNIAMHWWFLLHIYMSLLQSTSLNSLWFCDRQPCAVHTFS